MEVKSGDFVRIEYDLFANGQLVQTTSAEKAKKAGFAETEKGKFGPFDMILGKGFVLKALDEDIISKKGEGKENVLSLSAKDAFGERKKELIRTFPVSAFYEQKVRPVVGMVYDFNGMMGVIKSVSGGRVMVDFNSPLAGKEIRLVYSVVSKLEKVEEMVGVVFEKVLRLPKTMFKVEVPSGAQKEVVIGVPKEILGAQELVKKSLLDFISVLKDYSIKIQTFKN